MVLCVGRQDRQKGLDTAVEAAAVLLERGTSVRLFIAGRAGKHTGELERLIDSRGLRKDVVLLGDRDDVPDLLAAADVFLFPSRWEGMGGSIVEAMALEVPMVLSDLATTREVAGDTGEYARPGDPRAFADALERVQRVETGDRVIRARRRFEQLFTVEASAEGIFRLYCQLLDKKRKVVS
jgi:glycosyltransferase involved in cell wall biosynthesis